MKNSRYPGAPGGKKMKNYFSSDAEGRLVIQDGDDASNATPTLAAPNHYLEAQTSKDGYKRVGPRGIIKFNKDKGAKHAFSNADMDLDGEDDAHHDTTTTKAQKKGGASSMVQRSKKRNGDARRKTDRFEPYAYIPLDPKTASKRRGHKARAMSSLNDIVTKKSGKGRR